MTGDEFVRVYPDARAFVATFPLVEGVSDALTEWLDSFIVDSVDYSTYVDTMGHQAVPMLVAIVTGSALPQEDPDGDSDEEQPAPDPTADVHDRAE